MTSGQCLGRMTATSLRRSPLLARSLCTSSSKARLTCSHLRNTSTALSRAGSSLLSCSRPSTFLRTSQIVLTRCRGYADKIVKVPEMAESITEGTLKQFSKQVGDYVEQDEEIATIETDKIDVAVNAPSAGTIKEFLVKEDDTVNVGQDLLRLELGGEGSSGGKKEAKSEPKAPASEKQETSSQPDGAKEKESSAAKQAASESKSEATKGESKSDQKPDASASAPKPAQDTQSKSQPSSSSKPSDSSSAKSTSTEQASSGPFGRRDERRVKMNRMRLRISERLKQSQNTAASLTTFNEVDMSSLMEFRKLYKDEILKKTGVKLGFMSAFSRACCLAIKELPSVNASIEGPGAGDTIVYKDYVDISVAVATEKGLVTPVVRNAESMDMVGIEKEIADLGKKARDNKLTIEDMAGGTFTISNGGVFGSLMGTPIINLPQTAVLGLHAIKEKPVALNGKVEIRPMMYLALTYDHRLLDGREAVTFLVRVKEFIEDPRKMLLG